MASKTRKVLLLCDGNNLLCRGGFATPPLSDNKGRPTNAVKGFLNILLADIHKFKPTHVVVTWDKGGKPNWRKGIYPEYKGNRAKGEDIPQAMVDILGQAKPLRRLLKSLGIKTSSRVGEEADDIIGTLATRFESNGFTVYISSKDKDFGQLVSDNVFMIVPTTREVLGVEGIKEKFGVYPEQIQDFLVLQGDKVDNIPGVTGCGQATASKLLAAHKNLKGIIKNRHTMTPALLRNFEAAMPLFKTTKELVKLRLDMPLKTTESNCKLTHEIADDELFSTLCYRYNLKQTEAQIRKLLKTFEK